MWRDNTQGNPSSSANAASPPPPPPPQALESIVLGKRKANDATQHDSERFTKRFNLLSLGKGSTEQRTTISKLQCCAKANNNPRISTEANALQHSHSPSNYYLPVSNETTYKDAPSDPEPMSLDDSRHRVYISNLDSEYASIAASETAVEDSTKLIFLPDIERHFNQMPREMLRLQHNNNHHLPGSSPDATSPSHPHSHEQAQELVLYTLPRTLTQAHEGANSTRKAILEARQRAREKALLEAREREMNAMYSSSSSVMPSGSRSGAGGDVKAGEELETRIETAHGYGVDAYEEWRDAEEDDKDDDYDDDVMDMD
jgi:hypothetical protein